MEMPTALDNGQRSPPNKLLAAVVRRVLYALPGIQLWFQSCNRLTPCQASTSREQAGVFSP
jgi:hypothetical protein